MTIVSYESPDSHEGELERGCLLHTRKLDWLYFLNSSGDWTQVVHPVTKHITNYYSAILRT
jgi:hypothetical protein